MWSIYEEIKKLQDLCNRFVIAKIGREGNKAAHTLAAVAKLSGQAISWMGDVPPAVADIVEADAVNNVPHVI
jgi:hypothetical protein